MKFLTTLFNNKRYSLLYFYALFFLVFSTIIRCIFYVWSFEFIDFSILNFLRILLTGLFFDLGTISYFLLPYTLYLLILPNKLIGSVIDKSITYFAYTLGLIIFTFSFLAEFTFWEEFKTRFNFIAVDYLVYTYEVVENINQSYPMPILISGILLIVGIFIFITSKLKTFNAAFTNTAPFKQRIPITIFILTIVLFFTSFINNKNAEWSINRYETKPLWTESP